MGPWNFFRKFASKDVDEVQYNCLKNPRIKTFEESKKCTSNSTISDIEVLLESQMCLYGRAKQLSMRRSNTIIVRREP